MILKGRAGLVTGASSGIDQAIAIAVAQKGATAVVAYRENKEGAKQTLKEVERYGVGHLVQADLSDQAGPNRCLAISLSRSDLSTCS